MSIAKANIITFVNDVLRTSYSGTELDTAIQACLNDLANANLLQESVDATDLASGDLSIDYPTDFKELISIFLTNASGVESEPLKPLEGGYKEYRQLRDNDDSTDEPEFYAEFDNKFWLWRPSNGVYTPQIDYYRYHPQSLTTILFGNEFTNAINFGTTYYRAKFSRRPNADELGALYFDEKAMREACAPSQPYIVRS